MCEGDGITTRPFVLVRCSTVALESDSLRADLNFGYYPAATRTWKSDCRLSTWPPRSSAIPLKGINLGSSTLAMV